MILFFNWCNINISQYYAIYNSLLKHTRVVLCRMLLYEFILMFSSALIVNIKYIFGDHITF